MSEEFSTLEEEVLDTIAKMEEEVAGMLRVVANLDGTDRRSISIARTNLQQGFLWAIRSVAAVGCEDPWADNFLTGGRG